MTGLDLTAIPPNASPQVTTVLSWLLGFATKDDLLMTSSITDSYVQHFLPSSLRRRPVVGKDALVKSLKSFFPHLYEFEVSGVHGPLSNYALECRISGEDP